jgi:quercetin dioxygenase-like cupin family protein
MLSDQANTSSSSSTHADGQTDGDAERPADDAALVAVPLDLAAEVELLHQQESWRKGDHTAKTLVKQPDLRVVVTALRQGGRIEEHRAPGRITIQTLTGRLRLHAHDKDIDLPAGHIVVLEPGAAHGVEALEESAFLLTIVWAAGAHPAAE